MYKLKPLWQSKIIFICGGKESFIRPMQSVLLVVLHVQSYNHMCLNRGIKHDFSFINICKVLREVLKTEGEA